MPQSTTPLPVVLVTGFLGSGKTTCLLRLARSYPEDRLAFLVNELAESDVDAGLLASQIEGTPQSIVGGSLFCECKAGEFVRALREVVLPEHARDPFRALVIETSGMADPGAVGTLLRDHGLSSDLILARVVTVVAAGKFKSLAKNLPVVREQLRFADQIILNKCDRLEADQVREVEEQLTRMFPGVRIDRTTFCEVQLPLDPGEPKEMSAPLATCEANPFTARVFEIPRRLSLAELGNWLENLPPYVLRVKGAVETRDFGWQAVQLTVDSKEIRPSLPHATGRLVVIVHDDDADSLENAMTGLMEDQAS